MVTCSLRLTISLSGMGPTGPIPWVVHKKSLVDTRIGLEWPKMCTPHRKLTVGPWTWTSKQLLFLLKIVYFCPTALRRKKSSCWRKLKSCIILSSHMLHTTKKQQWLLMGSRILWCVDNFNLKSPHVLMDDWNRAQLGRNIWYFQKQQMVKEQDPITKNILKGDVVNMKQNLRSFFSKSSSCNKFIYNLDNKKSPLLH
jgi:hypothetical protein